MNFDRIQWHRPVILTALTLYEKQLEKVKKGESEAMVSTKSTEEVLAIVKELQEEFIDQRGKVLENTPMGDAMSDLRYQDTDGTLLTVDRLDEMLQSVGVGALLSEMGEWSFAQRQEVRRWADARRAALIDGTLVTTPVPEFISRAWITDRDGLLEREMPEREVEEWITRGPWGVRASDSTRDDSWQVYSPEVSQGSLMPDESITLVARPERVHKGGYVLDRALLIAANLNAIEEGKAILSGVASMVSQSAAEMSNV